MFTLGDAILRNAVKIHRIKYARVARTCIFLPCKGMWYTICFSSTRYAHVLKASGDHGIVEGSKAMNIDSLICQYYDWKRVLMEDRAEI